MDDFARRAAAQDAPAGFTPLIAHDGFMSSVGPIFARREPDGRISFGCRIMPNMCNPLGTAHGGWIASLVDTLLPMSARLLNADLADNMLLTVNLSIDYLGAARLGDWVQGSARILRRTRKMVFMDSLLTIEGETIARGSGVFRSAPGSAPPVSF